MLDNFEGPESTLDRILNSSYEALMLLRQENNTLRLK